MSSFNPQIVEPMSKHDIDEEMEKYLSNTLSGHLKFPNILDVERLISIKLSFSHGFRIEISNDSNSSVEAETFPFDSKIVIRHDVYSGICNNNPRDLFTRTLGAPAVMRDDEN